MSLRSDLEKLDTKYYKNAHVSIMPVTTQSDLIYAGFECQLTDEQRDLVNPFWFSIGRAYLYRDDNYPCIIYNEEGDPIGFINFSKWIGDESTYSWSFYIDNRYQGMGYGRYAAKLAISILKTANSKIKIKLSTEKCNKRAQSLYISLGFEKTDEQDGDDFVFCI